MRALRRERGKTLKEMAEALGVSSAYLSALEHGRRGRPTWVLMQGILQYFNIIWDDADELLRLADLSHPRVVIDTSGLSAEATLLANRLARSIDQLRDDDLRSLLAILDEREARQSGP
jgi:transcriptional regulator with XRE-family HTH domain